MNNHNHNHEYNTEKDLSSENNVLEHHHTVVEELLCHLPYAIFSVALAMVFLSFIGISDAGAAHACADACGHNHGSMAYRLFHNFHYLHLLFAGTGTILMFRKYSKNVVQGLAVGIIVPALFCTLSDAILPYIGGKIVNLNMELHWCFLQHLDTVLPFLLTGVLNGWVMSTHEKSRQLFYSLGFHFFHIFISAMASVLYLVSFGFHNWWEQMGFVFIYMIGAVLIPCTLADIVVPILFARVKKGAK